MICSRCANWNNEEEHRCTKCAARLNDRRVESAFHSQGALALQPAARESAAALPATPSLLLREMNGENEVSHDRVPFFAASLQQSLFSLRETDKVVSIDGLEPPRRTARKKAPKRRPVTASYLPQQGVLEFVPLASPQARKLATSVDARIFCERPVASVSHRVFAALYDLGIIGVLTAVFGGVLSWGCAELSTALASPIIAAILGAAAVLIGLLYHTVFLAARGETPGMRFAGLQLVDFDGRDTTQTQLYMRVLGAFLSVLPAGIGLLWAFVDEESLTWQDHISHTFPTSNAVE